MSLLKKMKAEAVRVKEEKEARGTGGFSDVPEFKPEVGDTLIRILPHWNPAKRDGDDFFFARKVIHYVPILKKDGSWSKGVPLACLAMFDEDCPFCNAHKKLQASKDKRANDLKPSEKYCYNIIDYGDGAKRQPAVMVYSASYTVHTEIMEWAGELDEEFWDLLKGRDFKLTKKVDKAKGAQFGTSYKIKPKMAGSAIPKKLLEGLDEKMIDLDTMYSENAREKMDAALEHMGIDAPAGSGKLSEKMKEMDDAPRATAKPAAKAAATVATKTAKVAPKPAPKPKEEEMPSLDDGFAEDEEPAEDVGEESVDLDEELKRLGV